jgi:drug/metabolite transporter (DMT)-like permease
VPAKPASAALTGILCVLLGLAVFSIQDLVVKMLAGRYPVHEVLAIRSLTALPIFLILAWRSGGLGQLAAGDWPIMLLRGAIMFIAFSCYYLAFAALPLATSVALYFTAPLFIMMLTVMMLREPVGIGRWLAVLVGFSGTVVIMQPGSSLFDPAALLPIAAALFYAASQMVARRWRGTGNALTFSFHANTVFLVGGLVAGLTIGHGAFAEQSHPSLAFLFRAWVFPTTGDLALMMTCGVVACAGSMLLAEAYRIASPPVVAPFEYSAIVWSVLNGWLWWRESPAATTWLGIVIIVAAGLYVLWLERRSHRPA